MGSRIRSCFDSAVGTAAVTGLGICFWAWAVGAGPDAPPQPSTAQGFQDADHVRSRDSFAHHQALDASRPGRVRIPAIRVDAPLMNLGLDEKGRLASPPEATRNLAGWYRGGSTPGEDGTALIAGHVDNPQGPGVFYDLGTLETGNTVRVSRGDGTTAVFSVYAVEVYDGDDFPDKKVYGRSALPELRLITCGGGFDRQRQEYRGNVVVFAVLTGTR